MAELVLRLAEIGLATVLVTAAVGKVVSPTAWRRSLPNYRIGWIASEPVAISVPLVEMSIGLGLALDLFLGRLGALVLFLVFAVVLTSALARGASGACNCFGVLAPSQIDRAALLRALALTGLSAAALLAPPVPTSATQPLLVLVLAVAALCAGDLLALARSRPRPAQ